MHVFLVVINLISKFFDDTTNTYSGDVTITGSVNVTQLKTINDAISGDITLNVTSDSLFGTASDLAAAFAGTVTTHTGTVIITDEPTAAQLKAINDASTGSITLNDVDGALSGTISVLIDAFDNDVTLHEGTVEITDAASTAQLTTIDASEAGNAAMTITAADIFSANDGTGDLTFNVTGTNGGGDTLVLSAGSESWSTNDGGATYTATGNFDGIAGEETYTINITDIDSVTI